MGLFSSYIVVYRLRLVQLIFASFGDICVWHTVHVCFGLLWLLLKCIHRCDLSTRYTLKSRIRTCFCLLFLLLEIQEYFRNVKQIVKHPFICLVLTQHTRSSFYISIFFFSEFIGRIFASKKNLSSDFCRFSVNKFNHVVNMYYLCVLYARNRIFSEFGVFSFFS